MKTWIVVEDEDGNRRQLDFPNTTPLEISKQEDPAGQWSAPMRTSPDTLVSFTAMGPWTLQEVPTHQPRRGDAVEAWLKSWRDDYDKPSDEWTALDNVLENYRLRSDTGTPLGEDLDVPPYA